MLHKKFTDDQDFYVHDSCHSGKQYRKGSSRRWLCCIGNDNHTYKFSRLLWLSHTLFDLCKESWLWGNKTSPTQMFTRLSSRGCHVITVISICHAIMQASQGLTFISPLQLTTGLFIHQTTRTIIDVLFSLGFCSSYDHVI